MTQIPLPLAVVLAVLLFPVVIYLAVTARE